MLSLILFFIITNKKSITEHVGANDLNKAQKLFRGECDTPSDCASGNCTNQECIIPYTRDLNQGYSGEGDRYCINNNDCLSNYCDKTIINPSGIKVGSYSDDMSKCQTGISSIDGQICAGRCRCKNNGEPCTNNYECNNFLCGSNNKCGMPSFINPIAEKCRFYDNPCEDSNPVCTNRTIKTNNK